MAILKCKMCGGDLSALEDAKIIECDFCGTTQTIPNDNDEKKTNLFNRANKLRMASEFDKASGIYENIIAEFPDESEAYWGLCLCKFGIEYVDDPKTAKKIPTCHRTSFESIFDDENYKMATTKSDVIAQGVYKEEANVIDNLQKDILSIVHKEEPFDVFICYKETDELGQRTQDSVLAQDIYDALTDKGFKVFFSRITLEDKLGKQYEPYIFAALNSAKVMLAIGTKEEYYNAVWVKNEWSRYLALMETDKRKMLIPCYRDIDPYDMPQEFKNLQGQDMSKLGFLQDLVRGISKIVTPEQNKPVNAEPAPTTSANATTDSLLKRAFMFLEDGNWKSAEEYCEKVLDIDPECAEAYLGKLMAELKVRTQDELKNYEQPFDEKNNYQKVMRFASDALKSELENAITVINERNDAEETENVYCEAKKLMAYDDVESYQIAMDFFDKILEYKDSKDLKEKCVERIEELKQQEIQYRKHFSKTMESYYIQNIQNPISAGDYHSVGVTTKGSVLSTKFLGNPRYYEGQCETSNWDNIISISAGGSHTVGLKLDGTVIAIGFNNNGECNVSNWTDIVSVSAGSHHTIGLKENGTVIAIGSNNFSQCDVSSWTDIVSISSGTVHTVGLKTDGTVVATGNNLHGACNVSDWKDIVSISAGYFHTLGLKEDGTVVAAGDGDDGECEVSHWRDIVAISAGSCYSAGLKKDGTVVTIGEICDVSAWRDIVAISAGSNHLLGLKKDGKIISTTFSEGDSDYYGQSDVNHWENMMLPIVAVTSTEFKTKMKEILENSRKKTLEDTMIRKNKMEAYRLAGVCQYCGGIFKGLFTKTCTKCGKKKDY